MKVQETYYKVVRHTTYPWFNADPALYSITASSPEWAKQYKPGEWTEATNNSYLFVFDSLEAARAFTRSDEEAEIWECEGDGPEKGRTKFIPFWTAYSPDLWRFWESAAQRKNVLRIATPKGTRFFKRVKITKRVVDTVSLPPERGVA
jgi:hypothetical protein